MTDNLISIEALELCYQMLLFLGLLFSSLNYILMVTNAINFSSFDLTTTTADLNTVEIGVEEFETINFSTTPSAASYTTDDTSTEGIFQIDDWLNQEQKTSVNQEERTPYPKILSFRILKLSITIVGLFGVVLLRYYTPITVIITTVFIGFFTTYVYYFLLKVIADLTIYNYRDSNFIGKTASVITEIPINGIGEVDLVILGERHRLRAWSAINTDIPSGTKVRIIKKLQSTCTVILL